MNFRIIKSPSAGTREILKKRLGSDVEQLQNCDAVGMVQGKLIDMVFVADIAEKAANVIVRDIRGSCPQNMVLLAIIGDTASVEMALHSIKTQMQAVKQEELQ